LASPFAALVTALGIVLSAGSATAVQMWFRAQARRSMFRRRQVSSRAATITEALAAIMWAGTAGLAAAGSWLALFTALVAIGVLAAARWVAPR
jgi:ABC-2 type transport system permease protein